MSIERFHPNLHEIEPVQVKTVLERDCDGRIWLRLPGLNELNLTSLYNRVQFGTQFLEEWARVCFQQGQAEAVQPLNLTVLERRFIQTVLTEWADRHGNRDMECMMAANLVERL